jgi:hypothetical protein
MPTVSTVWVGCTSMEKVSFKTSLALTCGSAPQGIEYGKKNRDKAAKLMTISQIAEAQTLARECLAKDYKDC